MNRKPAGCNLAISQPRASLPTASRRHSRLTVCVTTLLAMWILALPALAQETEVQFLSGHGKDDAVPWKFLCTSGANSGRWTNLPVPAQWDVQGFGTVPYQKDLTNAFDEKGLYAHEFTVPAGWSGRRIFLVFEGVMTDTEARLNDQSVGPVHQGGFYCFKYEVTPLVKWGGTNRLEVTVAKHSATASINNAERTADYGVFGGIYRPVYLEAVPPQCIEQVAIDAKADGRFAADLALGGLTNADEVEAQIQTLEGKDVGAAFAASLDGSPGPQPGAVQNADTNAPGRRPTLRLRMAIPSPRLWTAETPNLYQAEFRLKQKGLVLHQVRQRFGFRTLEVRDGDGLYVNGHKVILKGANRHWFWPDSGRCLSEAVQRLDINTLKNANMNAVRRSQYPPDAQFLDLCDELGLYVLDDLAGWQQHYDDEVGRKLVPEMVVRDVNHPCILFWDNGNEGGLNTNLDKLFRQCEGSYYAIKEIWSPIQVTRASNVVFEVENHFDFTDTRDCRFTWQLRNFATPLMTNTSFNVLRAGVLESPAIPPGETGIIKLSAAASKNADALALRVADPFGRELWTWVWRLRSGDTYRLTQEPALHHAIPAMTNGVITITAGELTASFSPDTGLLLGVRRGTQTFSLTNGPRLAMGSAKLRQLHFDDDGPDAFVSAKFDGDLKSVLWRVNGNGWINCNYTYTAEGTNDFFGVLFDYPEQLVTHKRWLGGGPNRVWKNRLRGTTLGVWEDDCNNTLAGWRDWIYPEFKGFFAGVHWLQWDTAEGPITVLNNNGVPFMQVLTPEFPPANLVGKAKAPVPECGLAFLDAIPPIGSKFKEARFGGPQGQPTLAHGEYTGSLSFYFGKLP